MTSKKGKKIATSIEGVELVGDDHNANKGTLRGRDMLRQSMREYGAARSAVADRDGRIIAGNKSLETAAELGLPIRTVRTKGDEYIVVVRDDLDLDDPRARELAYADNRVGQVSLEWDAAVLMADLENGMDLTKFWNPAELDILLADPNEQAEPEDFEELPEELAGAYALKDWMTFPSDEIHEIPPLDPDMLGDLPEDVEVWAGPDAVDVEREGWWVYNYGSDSIRGLDLEKTILAFYVDDYRFDRWFTEPKKYVSKALAAGIPMAISPNYSLWELDPAAVHIWATYRSRWVARYMQEAGIRIIPDVNWASEDSFEFCLAGIPKHAPCISIQVQTFNKAYGGWETREIRRGVEFAIRELEPQKLLLYGGGESTREEVLKIVPPDLPVVVMDSRMALRARVMASGKKGIHTKQ
jgi:hypothetical protein